MTSDSSGTAAAGSGLQALLETAARRVRARWVTRELLDRWGRYLPWCSGAAALAALAARMAGLSAAGAALLTALPLGVALALALGQAWRGRPALSQALAWWDRAAGRQALMVSAHAFLVRPSGLGGELLHVERAAAELPAALQRLPRDVPVGAGGKRWIWLLAPLAAWLLPLAGGDRGGAALPLGAQAESAARAESQRLERAGAELAGLAGADGAPDPAMAAAREELEGAAEVLETVAERSAEGLLSELEDRARALERMGRELADDTAWLSAAVIEELRRHVDTAELAGHIEARAALPAAGESENLAAALEAGGVGSALADRVGEALDRGMAVATAEDRERFAGEHLGNANAKLTAGRVPEAAGEFRMLADAFRRLGERMEQRRRLEDLAESVRQAGQAVASQSGASAPLAPADAGGPGQEGPVPAGGAAEPSPGAGLGQESPAGAETLSAPGAGAERGPAVGLQRGEAPGEGGLEKGEGEALLLQDRPEGEEAGGEPAGVLLAPIPGSAVAAGAGSDPGSGSGDPEGAETQPGEASQTGVVEAVETGEGPSETRQVAGAGGGETAERRSAEAVARAFLQAEEAALDDLPIPLGRREEVRLYLDEVRRRLEADGGS